MKNKQMKQEITEIIKDIIAHKEGYYLEDKYLRWGYIEQQLHAVIDSLLTPHEARPSTKAAQYCVCDDPNWLFGKCVHCGDLVSPLW